LGQLYVTLTSQELLPVLSIGMSYANVLILERRGKNCKQAKSLYRSRIWLFTVLFFQYLLDGNVTVVDRLRITLLAGSRLGERLCADFGNGGSGEFFLLQP